MTMNVLKKKNQGYILLLVMIIVSSIFLLIMSIVVKNRLANIASSTINIKHEQALYLSSALSIVKSLLSYDEMNKKKESKKNSDSISQTSKDSKDNIPLFYFNFYWKECNKWLLYTLKDDKSDLDGKISIYLTVEDGKLPLKKIITEYFKEYNKDSNNDNNSEDKEKKIEESKDSKKDDKNLSDEEKEKDIAKNALLKKLKELFEKNEEKSTLCKELDIEKKLNKNSIIMNKINNYVKKLKVDVFSSLECLFDSDKSHLPVSKYYGITKNNESKDFKEYGLYDLLGIHNEHCSLFFISPAVIEFLGQKKCTLNLDMRNKIIEMGKKYFDKTNSNEISYTDLWNTLYQGAMQIPYQKENFEFAESKKIYTSGRDIPNSFSALIKIEVINFTLFAVAYFEKNKRYVINDEQAKNENQGYFITSVHIIPFE
jgi:hypothetical protein